jgi:hypothetical protein
MSKTEVGIKEEFRYPKLFDRNKHGNILTRPRIISIEPGGWASDVKSRRNKTTSMSPNRFENIRV